MSRFFSSRQQSVFRDRIDAGAQLADELRPVLDQAKQDDIVAVGLARGGVIVAAEVAQRLGVRLEAIVIRKLGAPDQPELAIGALSASGDRVLNERLLEDIGIRDIELDRITTRAVDAAKSLCEEIGAPAKVPDIIGKTVLLVDDGLATGATMRVAIEAVRQQGAGSIIVAVPVAPASAIETFLQVADDVVTVMAPENLNSVGQWYQLFMEVSSGEVRDVLKNNRRDRQPGA